MSQSVREPAAGGSAVSPPAPSGAERPVHAAVAALTVALTALVAAPPVVATPVDWVLFDEGCGARPAASSLVVPCGALGELHFGLQGDAGDGGACPVLASGSEVPAGYPRPRGAGLDRPLPQPPVGGVREGAGWVAVIDWDDWHGRSVAALVETMGARRATSRLYALDAPELAVLGDTIGDQHVLASLCRVAEDAAGREEPLLAVNMSFGRMARGDDPRSADCDPSRLACQVARVLRGLREGGAVPVAAAGNHHELLFPARLDETLATGPIDLLHYGIDLLPRKLWEAPNGIDAIVPGHALCIGGQVAPAGSSYASAFFSGWLAVLAAEDPEIDAFAGKWVPGWSARAGCFVLSQSGEPHRVCNPALEEVLAGILYGGEASGCWSEPGSDGEPLLYLRPRAAEDPPDIAGFDEWAATEHHPAPESDPCIPCVGLRLSFGPQRQAGDLGGSDGVDAVAIALSSSAGLARGVWLDRIYFRNGDSYYPLVASQAQLDLIAEGGISGLVVEGLETLPPIRTQPSLCYVLKDDPQADCDDPGSNGACYWTSTPVLLR